MLNEVVNTVSFNEAYGSDGGRGRSSHSRSPTSVPYSGSSYATYEGPFRSHGWETERRGSDVHGDSKFDHTPLPQTLEDLELEYKKDAMDLARLRDQQEDEENCKHREAIRELRDTYMKRLAGLRGSHAKKWDEFLQLDAQRRQQQVHQQHPMPTPGFGGYQPSSFSDYDSLHNQPFAGSKFHVEQRGQYTNPGENYPHSATRDAYPDFQHQRLDGGYGRAYNRF